MSRALRVRTEALKGRKKIAQGDALGNSRQRQPKSHSDLGKPIWAVLHDDGPVGNLTHPEAMELAAKNGGYVTTNNAILNCD